MTTASANSSLIYGKNRLRDISSTETSLEEILTTLRKHHHAQYVRTHTHPSAQIANLPGALEGLNHLFPSIHGTTHQGILTAQGRTAPLLYKLLVCLMRDGNASYDDDGGGEAEGKNTISLIDLTNRFSPSHLLPHLPRSELAHVHVFQPFEATTPLNLGIEDLSPSSKADTLRDLIKRVEDYMLYFNHGSGGRVWKGTVIFGAEVSVGMLMTAGRQRGKENEKFMGSVVACLGSWKGWLNVEREDMRDLEMRMGISAKKAMRMRDAIRGEQNDFQEKGGWWDALDQKGWKCFSDLGEFVWR